MGVTNQNNTAPNCANVTADTNSFLIGDTPFGVDFEGGAGLGRGRAARSSR